MYCHKIDLLKKYSLAAYTMLGKASQQIETCPHEAYDLLEGDR